MVLGSNAGLLPASAVPTRGHTVSGLFFLMGLSDFTRKRNDFAGK